MEPSTNSSEPPLSDILPPDEVSTTTSPGASTTTSAPTTPATAAAVASDAALSVGGSVPAVEDDGAASEATVAMIAASGAVDTDEAVALLQRHVTSHESASTSTSTSSSAAADAVVAVAMPSVDPTTSTPTTPTQTPTNANGSNSSNVSAVYRWYDIEATLTIKRREESAIARCRLCRQQGRQERKASVRFSKSVTSNLWRHLKENHPEVYAACASEKKKIQMHKLVSERKRARDRSDVASAGDSSAASTSATSTTVATTTTTATTTVATTSGAHDESDKLLDVEADTERRRPPTKRARRTTPSNATTTVVAAAVPHAASAATPPEMFFHEQYVALNASLASAHNAEKSRVQPVNADRIREAAAFLSLYEMVPIELCSSLAFRNLLNECHASAALMDDASLLASVFGKQAVLQQAKRMVSDIHSRTQLPLKSMTDGVHLVVQPVSLKRAGVVHDTDSFLALFGLGLDAEFNPFYRCLCVTPTPSYRPSEATISTELVNVLKHITYNEQSANVVVTASSHRGVVKQLLGGELSTLLFADSITDVLSDVMVSTILDGAPSRLFVFGADAAPEDVAALKPFFQVFDPDSATVQADISSHVVELETPSAILLELPNVLTGHTIRDMLLKILHLMAHIKQSRSTRAVLRRIMVEEFRMDEDAYNQVFESGPASITVSIYSIHDVLACSIKMMPTLQRYFEWHKDQPSDFSKLMQLASLSPYEWERVVYLSSLVKPFSVAVTKLQDEQYFISSLVIPSVYTLLEKLRDISSIPTSRDSMDLPEDMVAMKNNAYARLSSSFGYLFRSPDAEWSENQRRTFNLLWAATLLDPRTRPFIIKGPLDQVYFWDLIKAEAARLAGALKDTMDEDKTDLIAHETSLDDEDAEKSGHHHDGAGSGDLWDDLQANLASCAQEEMLGASKSALEMTKSNNLIEVEVSFFQEEGSMSLQGNPLEWWQSMRIKYPYLARLARHVLSIPGHGHRGEDLLPADAGLYRNLTPQLSAGELTQFICATLNLTVDKIQPSEAPPRQLWSTV
ncbi:hypothetical protein PINS_up010387 [Pythium insidiosum]|nr:hypothetical protein PINS_up010387 [Pythium insidiosum]